MEQSFDVLIIGAGAAGLMAAKELSARGKSIALIEARNRTGGRIYTAQPPGFAQPADAGAEFVHGNLPLTKKLLKEAGAKLITISGSLWQHRNGSLQQQEDFIDHYEQLEKQCKELKEDVSVEQFIQTHLQPNEPLSHDIRNYVEGYYAADAARASMQALCQEWAGADEDQYRIEGGYQMLVDYLEQTCRAAGVRFFLGQPVWQLHWKAGQVQAVTDKITFVGTKALITVPIGVLQSEGITFYPALPHKTAAAKALGFGHVVKVTLQFSEAFWKNKKHTHGKNLHDLGFLFSDVVFPTWWTEQPKQTAVITGWLGGPKALRFKEATEAEITALALQSLAGIFDITIENLQHLLQGTLTYGWPADPFCNGAYSYNVVGGAAHMQTMLQPEAGTLYFADEGLHSGPQIGTVEAALTSGKSVAESMHL